MNIDDIKTVESIPDDQVFAAIATRQLELAIKYGPIEERNGFYPPDVQNPPSLDDRKFQHWIKEMFWRTTEEIAEALEPLKGDIPADWRKQWEQLSDVRHVYEEFADALHFLTEVTIAVMGVNETAAEMVAAWDSADFIGSEFLIYSGRMIREFAFNTINHLGLAANCLKNKPWKSTHMPTDQVKFENRLADAWESFFKLWIILDCDRQDIWSLYAKKNAVNQFRMRTQY